LTKSWFSGLANIRGNLYSVVDFAAFRGGDPTPQNAHSRLLLIGNRFGVNSALLVRRMLGLKAVNMFTVAPEEASAPSWVRQTLVDADGRHWRLLDVPALLADQAFMQVDL
jgi:twitching motility protein PilI